MTRRTLLTALAAIAVAAAIPIYGRLSADDHHRSPVPVGDPELREADGYCPATGGCFIAPPHDESRPEPWRREASERARGCLESRVRNPPRLGGDALERWTTELIAGCFAPAGTSEQDGQSAALPFPYAIHEGTGLTLKLSYFCTDKCPQMGHVQARFVDIPKSDCRRKGGIPNTDNGWGAYEGCAPAELAP